MGINHYALEQIVESRLAEARQHARIMRLAAGSRGLAAAGSSWRQHLRRWFLRVPAARPATASHAR
jgi:hypothetical protein